MTTLRLLTFNTLFRGDARHRLRALGARLAEADYDVVCLQEVMYRRGAGLLRRAAPAYRHGVYAGTVALRGGLVLLSRLPITRSGFVRYPMSGPLRPELVMRKGAQIVSVATGRGELVVVNTHLSANRDDDWSPGNRYTRVERAELDHLASRLAALDPAVPVVVAGDLNVPRDSAVLADFLAATGLRDVLAGDTRPTYRPTPQWPAPPAFDHVLIRGAAGRAMAGRARLVFAEPVRLDDGREVFLSDHYGVETTLEFEHL
ncbi:endonuclease/exonuclease/phosphatase family protein [Actinoplanes sp. NPDC023936]|uniref:endonuclease/exonuclease/phosphatase family protein n=1 Tax=Actinoplanes sp. NPDC023936 TaxID=3154910 RepID=UPI0033C22B42